jgi:PHD/YefM family antitoxin component YafN of YafNO toxin-antitoxin module
MKVTALELRQRLGSILERMDREQQPVIVEKDRKPRAVLLPLKLYRERFLDLQERALRDELVRDMREGALPAARDTVAELRRLRYGDHDPDSA